MYLCVGSRAVGSRAKVKSGYRVSNRHEHLLKEVAETGLDTGEGGL